MKRLQQFVSQREQPIVAAATMGVLFLATGIDASAQATGAAQRRDSGQSAGRELEEIVVTATRRREPVKEVPMVVNVVDPDVFATRGLKTLEDVAQYTPGVNFEGGQAPGLQTTTMRGVSQTLVISTVGFYLDEIPLGSSGQFSTSSSQKPDLVSAGMERIEILKGPQGTLYGATAMGGVVRYITKDPSLSNDVQGGVLLDASTTTEGSSGFLNRGWVSIPLVENRWGLRLTGMVNDLAGFIDRSVSSVDGAAEDVNDGQVRGGTMSLVGHITDDFTVSLAYLVNNTTYRGINEVSLVGPPFVAVDGRFDSRQSDRNTRTGFSVAGLTLKYDLPWGQLVSTTSTQRQRFVSVVDLMSEGYGPFIESFTNPPVPPGTVTAAPFTEDFLSEIITQEVRLNSSRFLNDRLEFIVGAYYSDESNDNSEVLVGQPINFSPFASYYPSNNDQQALFGNVTWFFTPKFDVTLGARFSDTKTDVVVDDAAELIAPDLPLTKSNKSNFTYLFNARYRPTDDVSLYTRIATGFRPQSAAIPLLVNGVLVTEPIIDQDTLTSYEVGVKGDALNRLIDFDFAAWHMLWKNIQARITVGGFNTSGNANADVEAHGLEGVVGYHPTDWLSLSTNFSYTVSEFKDDETASFGALAGEQMPHVPRWKVAADADFTFSLANDREGFFGIGARYVGDRHAGFKGGIGEDGSVITPRLLDFPLESYLLVDARLGFTAGKATISLYGTNLTNEFAYRTARVVNFNQGFSATAQILQPRTVGVVVQVDF